MGKEMTFAYYRKANVIVYRLVPARVHSEGVIG